MQIDGVEETGVFMESPDPNRLAIEVPKMWVVEHEKTRPDLQVLQTSVRQPKRSRRARRFTIEADGTLVYERKEEWEPPRDLQGYVRDESDPWRFKPLWPRCLKRKPKAKRTHGCGGIQITMICRHRDSSLRDTEVTHEQCQQCQVREI